MLVLLLILLSTVYGASSENFSSDESQPSLASTSRTSTQRSYSVSSSSSSLLGPRVTGIKILSELLENGEFMQTHCKIGDKYVQILEKTAAKTIPHLISKMGPTPYNQGLMYLSASEQETVMKNLLIMMWSTCALSTRITLRIHRKSGEAIAVSIF